jgi:hypothetical protein
MVQTELNVTQAMGYMLKYGSVQTRQWRFCIERRSAEEGGEWNEGKTRRK